jgi:hypothetical protein
MTELSCIKLNVTHGVLELTLLLRRMGTTAPPAWCAVWAVLMTLLVREMMPVTICTVWAVATVTTTSTLTSTMYKGRVRHHDENHANTESQRLVQKPISYRGIGVQHFQKYWVVYRP